jgi:hypothetical protein
MLLLTSENTTTQDLPDSNAFEAYCLARSNPLRESPFHRDVITVVSKRSFLFYPAEEDDPYYEQGMKKARLEFELQEITEYVLLMRFPLSSSHTQTLRHTDAKRSMQLSRPNCKSYNNNQAFSRKKQSWQTRHYRNCNR